MFAENSIDAVVTDPPYGLSKDPDIVEVLTHWLAGGGKLIKSQNGFMGRKWDSFVPGPATWREVFRVLKPGGYALVFAGTRTVDLMGIALRLAGFRIRDTIHWTYASGFPKNYDIAKGLELLETHGTSSWNDFHKLKGKLTPPQEGQRSNGYVEQNYQQGTRPGSYLSHGTLELEPTTELARRYAGYGSALKPAHEIIIVAQKPLEAGFTIVENVRKWGTGGLNIGGCRVDLNGGVKTTGGNTGRGALFEGGISERTPEDNSKGRWPANFLLQHSPDCVQLGWRQVVSNRANDVPADSTGKWGQNGIYSGGRGVERMTIPGNGDGTETVEAWQCCEGCPVAELDGQSGQGPSNGRVNRQGKTGYGFGDDGYGNGGIVTPQYSDTGGASRYYNVFGWDPELDGVELLAPLVPFYYAAKASKSERNEGLDDLPEKPGAWVEDRNERHGGKVTEAQERFATLPTKNHHSTVKPVALMRHLVRLVTPPKTADYTPVVLDPFFGSGTTLVAAVLEGFEYAGCDLDTANDGSPAGYMEIALARIAHAEANVERLRLAPRQLAIEGLGVETKPAGVKQAKSKSKKKGGAPVIQASLFTMGELSNEL
jgi:site-specific DNA-methyltransferase (adenine-specific)